MRTRTITTVMVLAVIAAGATVRAGPFYVDASRPDDTGDGLGWATAKKTIQAAVNAVTAPNDTVWVTNGIYSTASAYIQMDVAGMLVRSVNGRDHTTVNGGGVNSIFYIRNASDCLIEGFTITDGIAGSSPLRGGGGVAVGDSSQVSTNNTVSKCLIVNCQFPIYRHGYPTWSVTLRDSRIERCSGSASLNSGPMLDCEIVSNDWSGFSGLAFVSNVLFKANRGQSSNGGSAVADSPQFINGEFHNCRFIKNFTTYVGGALAFDNFWKTGGDWLFRNCLFEGNQGGSAGGAVWIKDMKKVTFENCTITANRSTSSGGGIYTSCTGGLFVVNCIVISNSVGDISPPASGAWMTNSCSSYSPPAGQGANNIKAWPQFVDWGEGFGTNNTGTDFSLQPRSPCKDKGADQDWMIGASDLAGKPRISGIVDMGAYEYQYPRGTIFHAW